MWRHNYLCFWLLAPLNQQCPKCSQTKSKVLTIFSQQRPVLACSRLAMDYGSDISIAFLLLLFPHRHIRTPWLGPPYLLLVLFPCVCSIDSWNQRGTKWYQSSALPSLKQQHKWAFSFTISAFTDVTQDKGCLFLSLRVRVICFSVEDVCLLLQCRGRMRWDRPLVNHLQIFLWDGLKRNKYKNS